ncbi:MAG: hypothetical protein ACO3IV_02005 [Ilumatobacteraceae bacterium]
MSAMYYLQLALISFVVLGLFWRDGLLSRMHVISWSILVAVLYQRYGAENQLIFYSNDQRYYASIVVAITEIGLPLQPSWWLSFGKPVYTLPATMLHYAGIDPALALKTVSIVSLLLLVRFVNARLTLAGVRPTLVTAYLTALGPIAVLYSTLALRETTMMLLATVVLWSHRFDVRLWSLIALATLRPHLAAALTVGLATSWLLRVPRAHVRVGGSAVRIIGGVLVGYVSYGAGAVLLGNGAPATYGHRWGISPVLQVASNFVGLQFLTVTETTSDFSVWTLLVSRLALSETIVIPVLFTLGVIVAFRTPQRRHVAVLVAFGFYIGLVTLTDFNSFRQNIPFMPTFGMLVVLEWHARRSSRRTIALAETSG